MLFLRSHVISRDFNSRDLQSLKRRLRLLRLRRLLLVRLRLRRHDDYYDDDDYYYDYYRLLRLLLRLRLRRLLLLLLLRHGTKKFQDSRTYTYDSLSYISTVFQCFLRSCFLIQEAARLLVFISTKFGQDRYRVMTENYTGHSRSSSSRSSSPRSSTVVGGGGVVARVILKRVALEVAPSRSSTRIGSYF